jgi:hypothetical protein
MKKFTFTHPVNGNTSTVEALDINSAIEYAKNYIVTDNVPVDVSDFSNEQEVMTTHKVISRTKGRRLYPIFLPGLLM